MKVPPWFKSVALAATIGLCGSYAQILIVNGASFNNGRPIAPGSFATVFGENLCPNTASATGAQMAVMLGGCSVTLQGTAALLSYVSPRQINFVAPENLQSGRTDVAVNNGTQVQTGSVVIAPAAPGVFAMTGMGMGDGAILHGYLWRPGPFSAMTDSQPTPLAIFLTGLDLTVKPVVTIGGVPMEVLWFGNAPGLPGLQQINILLPADLAGVGRVPVVITSNGQASNVIFIRILPTGSMLEGMPGHGDKTVRENERRGRDMSAMALNAVNNTVLAADEDDDSVRVISLNTKTTIATIALPDGSEPRALAVNQAGTFAAVALAGKGSVAIIDLGTNKLTGVVGSGNYTSHVAFAGANLLATNGANGTVVVIDPATRQITKTYTVGFGPSGIAANATTAVVANMQAGTLSLLDLATTNVSTVSLPQGSHPHEVAVTGGTAVITSPTSNTVLLLDLATKAIRTVDMGAGSGPGAVAAAGNFAYVANQMASSVAVIDLTQGKVTKTFKVDPGPRAIAVNAAKNQLLVLSEGTDVIDVIDLASYTIAGRIATDSGDTDRGERWTLPAIASISPSSGKAGTTVTLIVTGTNLEGVKGIEFHDVPGSGHGQGRARGGTRDDDIKVSNVQVNGAGTQVTAKVEIAAAAVEGTRQVRLETERGEVMGPMSTSLFTITKQ